MNKFAVIIPYFGKFKPSISLFLESCNRNPEIDWFIFTDCVIPETVILGRNINWCATTLEAIASLAAEKLGFPVNLLRPYKLCDLKPFYGIVFSDYLESYEYWGFGDTDVIYGNLVRYLQSVSYADYDKINWMGHLCFIRNTTECTYAAMNSVPGTIEAREVLRQEKNIGFDEHDFNRKCIAAGMRIYMGKWSADIDIHYWRMRCADLKTFRILLKTKEIEYAPPNYAKQIFALLDGCVYRIYLVGRTVHFEEFAYIHFRKEVPIRTDDVHAVSYLFSRDGFIPLYYSKSQLRHYKIARKLIEQYNNQENGWQELLTFLYYVRRRYLRK